jgi:hypothetical protein
MSARNFVTVDQPAFSPQGLEQQRARFLNRIVGTDQQRIFDLFPPGEESGR